ncbi:MAG TPA: NAD(P)-binding domain-containing protein, partial [Bacteroidota bacterium]|nr:NAD(P)-binding domain-containing protein [Bacteroidota bacterium]
MVDLLVIGAGPSGLSTAIAARKAGLSSVILEQGGVADAIRRFPVNMT